ncbi:Hachiman antiphage defense system protein HamA [Rhodococcoides fascians]|jgi:hypothetical protein|uniref:Hachiman antiphage defense system protein HamA n=1 Tax=Rhodococcoides fascians TaxID=1828 RepID=UPI0018AFB88B|nr:Hachiman antiphage defense system protein HamA [Rhodococcus fascians]WQH30161.1 Hachiman antiphage defense system protein HamA [Rhodococcus fascians]
MTHFEKWCKPEVVTLVNGHRAAVLVSTDDVAGIETVASTLAEKYAKTDTLALIAREFGKPKVAEYLLNKFPQKPGFRSGDMGEILATSYLEEESGYTVGPCRLAHRDHQEWSMRGDDVLGAKVDEASKVYLAKGEAKSRAKTYERTVTEARAGLERDDGLPSSHSLVQFAERLTGTADEAVGTAVLKLQLSGGVRPEVVLNVMFLFTGNDPSAHVFKDLTAYRGNIDQFTMTLRVRAHQKFIKSAYEKALDDDT